MNILSVIFSFLSAVIASMGLGGGSILIIYLSALPYMEQTKAQGINLLFFIPCAVYSLLFYLREKMIIKEALLPLIIPGIIGALTGIRLLSFLKSDILSRLFGGFLIIIAVKEIYKLIKNRSEV